MMRRFITRACAVAAAGALLGTWAVTAASASGGGSATIHHGYFAGRGGATRFTTDNHALGLPTTAANSHSFAGYVTAVPAGSATVLTASFAVPTLSCTTTDQAIAPSTGVPVNSFKTISAAFVFTGCVSGTAVFFPGLVVNGTETDYSSSPFAAGDVIDLITKVSKFRTRVQVIDVTTGVTQKIIGPGASASGALVGNVGWGTSTGQLEGVPNFGKIQFKSCVLDGKTLLSWRPTPVQRVSSTGAVQITTGNFWPGGTNFTTRYVSS